MRRFRVANPAIRRLQLAFAGSSVGQWAASTAVTVFSFQAGGAAAVSLQLVLRMVPAALAAPVLSTFADRHSRVRVMVASDFVRVVVMLAMAALVVADAPYVLVLIASGLGGMAASAFEPAKSALLPSLATRPEELTAANVVSSSIDSVSFFAGPALGGLLLAVTSTEAVLCVTAATFVWSAVLVSGIRAPAPRAAEAVESGPGLFGQLSEGFRAVAGDARVRLLVGFFSLQTFVDGALSVLLAATAIDLLDLGRGGLGLLSSAVGIGGIVGAVASTALTGRRRLAGAFALGIGLWGLPLVLLGLVPATVIAVLALVASGLGNTLVDVSGMTLLQRAAPEDVVGRVFGILETVCLAAIALGGAAASVLLGVTSVEAALVVIGALLPVALAVRWRAVRGVDAAEVSPEDLALLRAVDIFAPLGAVALERLAEALEPVHAPAGEAVVTQGERGADRFYVIAAGDVDVSVDGKPVRTQGLGEYFGEIALLRDSPRTATVVARGPVELRALRREDFLAAVAGHAGAAAAADTVVGGRLATARPLAMAG
jgi:MFS family permease